MKVFRLRENLCRKSREKKFVQAFIEVEGETQNAIKIQIGATQKINARMQ